MEREDVQDDMGSDQEHCLIWLEKILKSGEVLLLSSLQRDDKSRHFLGLSDDLCKDKLLE